jgi:NosR/NirI family transcriptional regulator, nitrous oxide reductase regulator
LSTPTLSSSSKNRRWLVARMLPRAYRLAVLAAIAALVHAASVKPKPPDPVTLTDARTFFPDAARLGGGDRRLGGQTVFDEQGQRLGLVLTTSPHTDETIGYAGPSNLLIALDGERRVIGVRLLSSGDTQAHVDEVRRSEAFWKQLIGWRSGEPPKRVEGVSGSTLTSLAMAEAVERRLGESDASLRFPEPVGLAEVRQLFPKAASIAADERRAGWHRVSDGRTNSLGYAVRTSPYTDNARGYQGPTESLVAIAPDGTTVVGVLVRRSYDTPEYVQRVREDGEFLRLLTGRTIEEWAELDFAKVGIEGVSGATQTSFAVADGVKRRLAADRQVAEQPLLNGRWNGGLLAVIGGALLMTFTPLRASRRMRTIWQGVLIAVFLFWLGDLVSLALLAGWARHGVPWQSSPAVVLLVAVALLVPWTTRKQIYCQSICPHGAAQAWLGRFRRLHMRVPSGLQAWLVWLRTGMLAAGIGLAVFWLGFDLAWLEPFDGWVLKSAAAVSASLAIVGLIASLFVPMAYCRYGCPTGELLARIKCGGSHDRLGGRDWAAGGLVALLAVVLYLPRDARDELVVQPTMERPSEFSGSAFGTTWTVKVRGLYDVAALKSAVVRELERIESTLSHWRRDSATSQFNASETALATEQPGELIALVARAQELSRLTDGAFDITVAPLVDAWGFGPSGDKRSTPTEAEIQILLSRTGWQKLVVDAEAGTLRKLHPQVQIDLGSLLQGYAADKVAAVLQGAGVAEFLVEVGGELLARGSWEVAIEDPRDPEQPLRTLTLTDAGLATSGFYRATRLAGGDSVHHLISPHTGRPVAATATLAAVIAPTVVEADGWATALLAVGLPEALVIAEQQRLGALLVDPDHNQQVSSRGEVVF